MDKYNILVVDDDREIVSAIAIYLENEGMHVVKAYDGLEALEAVAQGNIHLIVMDIMMPKLDGMKATMRLREENNIPIILLSAKSEDTDKILGLNMGADDYITKPFNPVVLGAKIKALIRRNKKAAYNAHNFITAGPFRYSNMTLEFFKNEQLIPLSSKENVMMKLFISNVGRVFTKEQLYELVWGNSIVDENAIMVYISHLRNKIEDNPKSPRYIKTVWGLGYKFTVNEGE